MIRGRERALPRFWLRACALWPPTKSFFSRTCTAPARMGTLNLEALSFRYPGRGETVLDQVTLAIPAGGIFGLLGPNGAGKTTLISILAGQLRGATGSIRAGDEPLEALRRRRPRSLGVVPQEHAFYPMLTCAENLRFSARCRAWPGPRLKERIAGAAGLRAIESALARRAGRLSGGLKRRLNLAIGLLGEPEILLLDEPTVGVDPQSRAFLLESIRSLAGAAGRSSTPVTTWKNRGDLRPGRDHRSRTRARFRRAVGRDPGRPGPAGALHAADPPVAAATEMRRLLALWEKECLALSRDVLGLAVLFLMRPRSSWSCRSR